MAELKEESCLDAATVVNKEAAAHGQKEESCLEAATVVNKEAAAQVSARPVSCASLATHDSAKLKRQDRKKKAAWKLQLL
nr:hypothetical protein [Tanacetum cinerariifolium]